MSPSDHHLPDTEHIPENVLQLLSVCKILLLQGVDVVDNALTSDEQLTTSSKFLPGSTIGKHIRHARDHFELLLAAITSPPPYILCYDTRSRNTPMESSRSAAKNAILETISLMEEKAPTVDFNHPLTLNAITPHMQRFESTFGRELWFAALHCIHHWSVVRVITGEMGVTLSEDFGYAPSTLLYQGRVAPLGMAKI
ncbi:hypothetical protein BDZ89DRAFT_1100647 [Hymenopellis radicata]|nr:hypothetical protein BDZ89DRAFT_1100647 [Hymenopellis radicata]